MGKKEKLQKRLMTKPKDFMFTELEQLMNQLGYKIAKSGKTGGSKIRFENDDGDYIRLHKPHQSNTLKAYQVSDVISALVDRGLL